jgi:hypothetical protein
MPEPVSTATLWAWRSASTKLSGIPSADVPTII